MRTSIFQFLFANKCKKEGVRVVRIEKIKINKFQMQKKVVCITNTEIKLLNKVAPHLVQNQPHIDTSCINNYFSTHVIFHFKYRQNKRLNRITCNTDCNIFSVLFRARICIPWTDRICYMPYNPDEHENDKLQYRVK